MYISSENACSRIQLLNGVSEGFKFGLSDLIYTAEEAFLRSINLRYILHFKNNGLFPYLQWADGHIVFLKPTSILDMHEYFVTGLSDNILSLSPQDIEFAKLIEMSEADSIGPEIMAQMCIIDWLNTEFHPDSREHGVGLLKTLVSQNSEGS